MTVKDVLGDLSLLGNEKTKAQNIKSGVKGEQFGVKLGDLRKVAKKIKINHTLALELWETGNFDARMLAILIIIPKEISYDEMDTMVRTINYSRVADWFNAYIVKVHPNNEELRVKWMQDKNPMAARAGWNLTSQRIAKSSDLLDIPELLFRINAEMATANPLVQWTMNFTLVEIGIHHPKYRKQTIEIGEKLGIYRNYPASKGCTSPFAPIWINEMVSRQE